MLAQFPARNAFVLQDRTKILEKRQPQTSESRDHCRGKLKTDQFVVLIGNVN